MTSREHGTMVKVECRTVFRVQKCEDFIYLNDTSALTSKAYRQCFTFVYIANYIYIYIYHASLCEIY